jgi:hypothetical protein
MTVLHPVAANADAALNAPLGRAARERDAAAMAGAEVTFVVEPAGPAFDTREAALDAYAGRVEDDRPGRMRTIPPEDRWCELKEMLAVRAPAPVRPLMADGRRWPEPPPPPRTVWRLSVAYWKLAVADSPAELEQARRLRRQAEAAAALDAAALRRLAVQPLRPVRPQQPLDLGLFERRLPENPDVIVPDE